MKLLFKRTVNDATCAGRAFFAGRTYELSEDRAKEIMKVLPDAVEAVGAPEPKPKKKTNKKKKEKVIEKNPEAELIADELEHEVAEFIETPTEE